MRKHSTSPLTLKQNKSITVLLIEDNKADTLEIKNLLPPVAYNFIEAVSLVQGCESLRTTHVDVILLSLSHTEELKILKELVSECVVPLVVLTCIEDISFAVDALRAGARDYLVKKHLTAEALSRSISLAIESAKLKAVESQLAEMAAIVASSDAAIVGKSMKDIVTSWNDAAERIYGYSAEEMLGKNISILLPGEVFEQRLAVTERLITGEGFDHYETRRRRKDGVLIDVAITLSPVRNSLGTVIGASAISRDITKSKRTQRLHAALNHVTLLLSKADSLSEGAPGIIQAIAEALNWSVGQIWQIDPVENVLRNVGSWPKENPGYAEFTAHSSQLTFTEGQDLLGRVWLNKKPEWTTDLSDEISFSRAGLAAKTALRFVCSFPILSGDVLGVIEFFNEQPSELDSEVQEMMTNACSQIWQFIHRKLAEEVAHQSMHATRTIAQAILENAPIGIAKLTVDLKFTEVNFAFSRQFGVSMDILPGKSMLEVIVGLPVESLLEVVRDGTTFRAESVRIFFDGIDAKSQDTCWDLAAWPIKDVRGVVTGVILLTADATERAKLSRQREDFVATLTHDLKNPLIGQNRMLDLFIDGAFGLMDSKQVELLSKVKTSTNEMLELISTLLEIYRYDAGAQQLRFEDCDMKELVDGCLAQAQHCAESRGIKLISSVAGGDFVADRMAMRRVFMNLFDNAIKFADPNSRVEVSCDVTEQSRLFEFKDSGPGIAKDQLVNLFERFGQADLGRSVSAGTGLGLYLCRQIVQSHGGVISCQSELGVGTKFLVSLPIRRETPVAVTK